MHSRSLRLTSVVALLLPLLAHTTASAQSKDADAIKLADEAIMVDYLAMKFDAAAAKLEKAIKSCEPDQCSKPTLARLHRDLGTVLVAGSGQTEKGKAEFKLALQADPSVQLDKDLSSDLVIKAFADAKKSVSAAPEAPAATEPAAAPATEKPKNSGKTDAKAEPPASPETPAEPPVGSGNPDCPPDFPGCGPAGAGSECSSDSDCKSGLSCSAGTCSAEDKSGAAAGLKHHQVSLGFQLDAMMIGGQKDVCSGGNAYNCFFGGGVYYAGLPLPSGAKSEVSGNEITKGGFAAAGERILVGYDYRLSQLLSLGARVGIAFGGGPSAPKAAGFLPLHFEVRGSMWLGRGRLAPYALLAGGVAQTDAKVAVDVRQPNDTVVNGQVVQRGFPGKLRVDAWRTAGLAFVNVGAGALFKVTEKLGPFVEVKLGQSFPTTATIISAQLGGTFLF